MLTTDARLTISLSLLCCLCAVPAAAQTPFFFSTGDPDEKIATATRPDVGGKFEIESADDFVLTKTTSITSATFTGLLTGGATIPDIGEVVVEIYRVFPKDSSDPPSGNVPTRVNSPSDVAFGERVNGTGLSFSTDDMGPFSVLNSVQPGGIHPAPLQTTGGDGPVTGEEVKFNITFTTPFTLAADHYFFVPQVEVADLDADHPRNFLWLSAAKPIEAPGTPLPPGFTDLQSWTRDEMLDPDWLRVGSDIVGAGAFNAAFSLTGNTVPEPSTWAMMLLGFAGLGFASWRHARQGCPASA